MGLDSVELVIAVEETFGIAIHDADAEKMVSPGLLIDYVCSQVGAVDGAGQSLTENVFAELRGNLAKVTGLPAGRVSKDTPIKEIFPMTKRKKRWERFLEMSGSGRDALPDKFPNFLVGPGTVGSLAASVVFDRVGKMEKPIVWTRPDVREVVRLIIVEHLGVDDQFSDDDLFFEDLGLD